MKRKASDTDHTPKFLAATCCAELIDHEHRTKLGCTDESLKKSVRRVRQKLNHEGGRSYDLSFMFYPSFIPV